LALGNLGISNCICKQAILIHQPQIMYNSKHFGNVSLRDRFRIWAVKRRVKHCLKTTDIIFCQTPVARQRFAENLSYPIEKIKVMHNAVSEFAKFNKNDFKVNPLFNDKNKFNLFFLTRYMPHKNMEVLIDLFTLHADTLRDVRCIITIEESQHKNAKKFLDKIKRLNLQDKIINVGRLQQHELAGFFLNCDALFLPTLLESFSGTYLEAMHFGVPILTSDLDFAKYVCEESALYFDPWNPEDIAEKISFLKKSSDLQKELIKKGKERIEIFFKDWETIVNEMLLELEKLYLCDKES
jgi:glycosyltransferase involved in cell wall biosynthesis